MVFGVREILRKIHALYLGCDWVGLFQLQFFDHIGFGELISYLVHCTSSMLGVHKLTSLYYYWVCQAILFETHLPSLSCTTHLWWTPLAIRHILPSVLLSPSLCTLSTPRLVCFLIGCIQTSNAETLSGWWYPLLILLTDVSFSRCSSLLGMLVALGGANRWR